MMFDDECDTSNTIAAISKHLIYHTHLGGVKIMILQTIAGKKSFFFISISTICTLQSIFVNVNFKTPST